MLLTCRKQWQQTCIQTPRLSHTAHSFNVCLPYTLRVTEWPLCASVYGHYKRGSHSVIRWLWELNIFPLFFYLCIYRRRSRWHPTPVLLPGKSHGRRSLVGCSPWGCQGSDTTETLHFHALEKEMAAHSSVPAWRIPGTGEPGGLLSVGSHRVGRDFSALAAAAVAQ